MTTLQEQLWQGPFGNEYTARQEISLEANVEFFRRCTSEIVFSCTVIEFGAGVGANIKALAQLRPLIATRFDGVELNAVAYEQLKIVADRAYNGSILAFRSEQKWDLVLTKGLLIHIAPEDLPRAYDTLYRCCGKYMLIAEYYSPRIEEIPYRGQRNALWKGPYAEQILDRHTDMKCIDYGFVWKRDKYPQDDITWFLMEKQTYG